MSVMKLGCLTFTCVPVDPSLKSSDEEVIYMLSHGLGLQPKKAKEYVMRDMDVAAQLWVHFQR